jgi:hypothetical protein
MGHDLTGEEFVRMERRFPVGPFVGHEQKGAETTGLVDEPLDLGHRHLRSPHHGEARLHQRVDELVGVEGVRGER